MLVYLLFQRCEKRTNKKKPLKNVTPFYFYFKNRKDTETACHEYYYIENTELQYGSNL